jgi:hypothetical protein
MNQRYNAKILLALVLVFALVTELFVLSLIQIPTDVTNIGLGKNEIRWHKHIKTIEESQSKQTDLLFFGTSSLFNAIDTDEFKLRTGDDAINLGLFGSFGTFGSYQLYKRWVDSSNPIPKAIVIWIDYDVWSRSLTYRDIVITNPNILELLQFEVSKFINEPFSRSALHAPIKTVATIIKAKLRTTFNIYTYAPTIRTRLRDKFFTSTNTFDYDNNNEVTTNLSNNEHQQRLAYWSTIHNRLQDYSFNASFSNTFWLQKLVELATNQDTKVFFSFGPLNTKALAEPRSAVSLHSYIQDLRAYLTQINRGSASILGNSHLLFDSTMGGDIYHVNRYGRNLITNTFAQLYNQAL